MAEAWLRGPVEGVSDLLMPAAHSLIDAREEIATHCSGLTREELWMRPGDAASIGFHLKHIAGSIDRLLTYAAGGSLTESQLDTLKAEGDPGSPVADTPELLNQTVAAIDRALEVMKSTDREKLFDPRLVGRAGLPSTVFGLLFHLAEHTRRHAGQIIATSRCVRG